MFPSTSAEPRGFATLLRLVVILAALGMLGIAVWSWAVRWRPSPATYPLQGVDLPLDVKALDWGSVRAAGADFAYLAATDATTGRAPAFEANWQALPEAGLRRGAIHLFDPCGDGAAQADAFNAMVPQAEDALPPAVDVSPGDCKAAPAAVLRELRRFAAAVEAHVGKPLILRIARGAERRWRLSAALERPVWVTGDFLRPSYAAHPWRLWRASDLRRIDGVATPLAWDVVAP